MLEFKYRKANYRLERDKYQFILTTRKGDTYGEHKYFADGFYLVKHLVQKHVLDSKKAVDLLTELRLGFRELGDVLNKAIPASIEADEDE